MPGFKNFDIYSLKGPNYAKAKALAQGNTRDGKAVMYTFNTAQGPPIAQSVQFNLKQIGIDVEIKLFDRVVQHEKTATRGEPFDLTLEGWVAGLSGSGELHQRAARRPPDPGGQQRQRVVLQQPDVQRADGQGLRDWPATPAPTRTRSSTATS